MINNFDLIATVDIDVVTPLSDDASFDSILIIGPLPATGTPALCAEYKNLDAVEEAGWVATGDNADPVGIAANIAFAQKNRPNSIWIAPLQTTTVNDQPVKEPVLSAVQRAMAYAGWYVVCPVGIADTTVGNKAKTVAAQYADVAAYIETQEKMFCYTELDVLAAANANPTVNDVLYRTMGVYGRETSDQTDANVPAANKCMNVALAAEWLTYASGSETAAFKQLAKVQPSTLASDEVEHLVDANLNYVVAVGNRTVSMNGITLAGEWADVIRFRDWLKHEMQNLVVATLLDNPKIPFTDGGIALIQNQMLAALKAGQKRGGIAGEEFDENGESIPAYTTTVPMSSALSAAQKASRKLTNCKFKARLAGAIHFAELKGSLTYAL